jgi:hypothetical protein
MVPATNLGDLVATKNKKPSATGEWFAIFTSMKNYFFFGCTAFINPPTSKY